MNVHGQYSLHKGPTVGISPCCTTYMVYMKADAEQYNYKMYRWRSTYLAAANNYKQ